MKKDKLILFLISIIILVGLFFVYSSSSYLAFSTFSDSFYFLKKQLVGVVLFFIFFVFFSNMNLEKIIKHSHHFFFISLLFCLLPYVPFIGLKINGANRWINLYFCTFQPVEMFKPFFILFCAFILSKYRYSSFLSFFFLSLIIFISSVCLLLQPDFGHFVLLSSVAVSMFIINNPRKNFIYHCLWIGTVIFSIVAIMKPYRIKRLLVFLDPWSESRGSGFQIIQSLIAINNGSWFGLGFGASHQKLKFLPMQHTDFIYSIICEEGGVFIGILIILLFLFLTKKMVDIAHSVFIINNNSGLIMFGFAFLFFFQASMNILVATAAVPTKGIGLPIISYGISSLVGYGILFGLFISCSKIVNIRNV